MVGAPAILAGGMGRRVRQCVIVVCRSAAGCEKARERIAKPQSSEDIHGRLTAVSICFSVKHRDVRWQTVVPPHLHDTGDELRFLVEILPRRLAAVVRIMLEG